MIPHASHCLGCSAVFFPPRLRCHHCGGMAFEAHPIGAARVAAVTRVHRAPPGCEHTHLVELESTGGLRLLAAAGFSPAIGSFVHPVQSDDGAIVLTKT